MTLDEALRQFDLVEANLSKAEKVWDQLYALVPAGIAFVGESPEARQYRKLRRELEGLFQSLPSIDGWRVKATVFDLDDIAQARLDAREIDEFMAAADIERDIAAPGIELEEYRARMGKKRRELVRARLSELVEAIDGRLRAMGAHGTDPEHFDVVQGPAWSKLNELVREVDRLLGSPPRSKTWSDLYEHLAFSVAADYVAIRDKVWPALKLEIAAHAFDQNEPSPVAVADLGQIVSAAPSGPVRTSLKWENLDDDGFEGLVFSLICDARGYENPEWLMRTRAADRGRDLSVWRVTDDALGLTRRERVIIQCKHWQSRSVTDIEISACVTKCAHWEPPAIDTLIVVTSGRFTADAVQWVEKHNHSGKRPRIELWPENLLERQLAARPALAASLNLR